MIQNTKFFNQLLKPNSVLRNFKKREFYYPYSVDQLQKNGSNNVPTTDIKTYSPQSPPSPAGTYWTLPRT